MAHLNSVQDQNFKLCDVKVIAITGAVIDNPFVVIAAIQANTYEASAIMPMRNRTVWN